MMCILPFFVSVGGENYYENAADLDYDKMYLQKAVKLK